MSALKYSTDPICYGGFRQSVHAIYTDEDGAEWEVWMRGSIVLQTVVTEIAERLVAGDYNGVARRSGGVRVSASDLEHAVRDYGGRLVSPPDHAFTCVDSIAVAG